MVEMIGMIVGTFTLSMLFLIGLTYLVFKLLIAFNPREIPDFDNTFDDMFKNRNKNITNNTTKDITNNIYDTERGDSYRET